MNRRKEDRPVPNTNVILAYLHCRQCLEEAHGGDQRLEVGWTLLGLQVWCARHDMNIVHIDFEGQQHPANATAARGGDLPYEH